MFLLPVALFPISAAKRTSILLPNRFAGSSSRRFASSSMSSSSTYVPLDQAIQLHRGNTERIAFVDGTWYMPNTHPKTSREIFEAGPRISGAIFFDMDDLKDTTTSHHYASLPHMMSTPGVWAAYLKHYDINPTDRVIVYAQQNDCPMIHRAFVQFWTMGQDNVHILDGSLQDWKEAGGPIETHCTKCVQRSELDLSAASAGPAARAVVDMAQVKALVARSPDRFVGQVDEPRQDLRRGHIPGSKNVFFKCLLNKDKPIQLLPRPELESILQSHLKDRKKKFIVSCGSGVTACTIKVALMECGVDPNHILLYDGSWTEWGDNAAGTPIVTGCESEKQVE